MYLHQPDMRSIKAAAKKQLSHIAGVQGFGIGDRALRIYVQNNNVCHQLPTEFQGVRIDFVVTGDISSQDLY